MKFVAVAALAVLAATPALAQDAPAPVPATAAAKFSLDTPIEALAADAQAKAVLDADFPGMTAHEHYDTFKGMTLTQLQPLSDGKITDEALAKAKADLAAIK